MGTRITDQIHEFRWVHQLRPLLFANEVRFVSLTVRPTNKWKKEMQGGHSQLKTNQWCFPAHSEAFLAIAHSYSPLLKFSTRDTL